MKIGVIDIGSNTVRLVVFDGLSRVPFYVFNEKAQCRLGAGLAQTGCLSPEGVVLAREALKRFVYLARSMGVDSLDIVGTAALREADDGPAFVQEMSDALDVEIRVIDGEAEAELSAKGVLLGWPDVTGIVCDIGGSSVELVAMHEGQIGKRISLKLGPLKLQSMAEDAQAGFIKSELNRAKEFLGLSAQPIYLVGGSWRAIAKLDMLRRDYPLHILHEYDMPVGEIRALQAFVAERGDEIYSDADISSGRAELLPLASKVLAQLSDIFQPENYLLSSYGLREGLFYERLSNDILEGDPLIGASESLELAQARFPGFGAHLFEWIKPLYAGSDDKLIRLVEAACYLHDINWRFHPDFRAQMSFENVAQINICGATHEERVFLALAVASRYKNSPNHAISHTSTALLDDEARESSIELGRAIRLGAKTSAGLAELLAETRLEPQGDVLQLVINKKYQEINGMAIEKQLNSLGKLSGKQVEVVFE